MIFVTVGTHEQPFERLLREVDRLVESGAIAEEVFCQAGPVQTRVPSAPTLAFEELKERLAAASVVVSHGGPGTIMAALGAGRPLVLVPRQKAFGEHVDDHQVAFCRLIGRESAVPVVEDISELGAAIEDARRRPRPQRPETGTPGVENMRRIVEALLRESD